MKSFLIGKKYFSEFDQSQDHSEIDIKIVVNHTTWNNYYFDLMKRKVVWAVKFTLSTFIQNVLTWIMVFNVGKVLYGKLSYQNQIILLKNLDNIKRKIKLSKVGAKIQSKCFLKSI